MKRSMRNRAKCKLCGDIIESFHPSDCVGCKCGQIGVEGGSAMRTYAIDYANFLRVDDIGNEIVVNYKNRGDNIYDKKNYDNPPNGGTVEDLIKELDDQIKDLEKSSVHSQNSPINKYDFAIFMLVTSTILKKLTKLITGDHEKEDAELGE